MHIHAPSSPRAGRALIFTIAGMALCAAAQAQSAGTWQGRIGVMNISPNVSSGDLTAPSLAHTQADIKAATQLSGGISYMLTDQWAVDVPLALPFKHDLVGDGAIAGVGKIGEVKALPITVMAQYRFMEPNAQIRPYLGLGLTYAKFFKDRSTAVLSALTGGTPAVPTTLKVGSKLTATMQAGAQVVLSPQWFLNASVGYTPLKVRTTLSTGQTLDAKINPTTLALEVGTRF